MCVWIFDGQNILDKRSYLEIDSMSFLIKELIENEVEETTLLPYNGAQYPPSRECVIKSCLDQYESKDMHKMAKRASKRIKKMTPQEIFMSNQ